MGGMIGGRPGGEIAVVDVLLQASRRRMPVGADGGEDLAEKGDAAAGKSWTAVDQDMTPSMWQPSTFLSIPIDTQIRL
jgi:hypothetical protein